MFFHKIIAASTPALHTELLHDFDIDQLVPFINNKECSILVVSPEQEGEDNLLVSSLRNKYSKVTAVSNIDFALKEIGLHKTAEGYKPDRRKTKPKPQLIIANLANDGLRLQEVLDQHLLTEDIPIILYTTDETLDCTKIKLTKNAKMLPLTYQCPHYENLLAAAENLLAFSVAKINLEKTCDIIEEYGISLVTFISRLTEIKEEFSDAHADKVGDYSYALAKRMGLSDKDQRLAYFVGKLHDIGKAHIEDRVLSKPGSLTEDERKIMKRHSWISGDLLRKAAFLEEIAYYSELHHESPDGSGYRGLTGKQIPLIARIVHLADAYDAMTNVRIYKKTSKTPAEAQIEIENLAGRAFDREVVEKGFSPWFREGRQIHNAAHIKFFNREDFQKFYNDIGSLEDIKKNIENNKNFIKELRYDLIKLLVALVTKNTFNVRGYNPLEAAEIALTIAKEMGLSFEQQQKVYLVALIGGIGQMFVSDKSIYKPGKPLAIDFLSDEQAILNLVASDNKKYSYDQNNKVLYLHITPQDDSEKEFELASIISFLQATDKEKVKKFFKDQLITTRDRRHFLIRKGLYVLTSVYGFSEITNILHKIFESSDGKNSLFGYSDKDIPIESKILAVAIDYYIYKDTNFIKTEQGKTFNTDVVNYFESCIEKGLI